MDTLTWDYLFNALDHHYEALQKSGLDVNPTEGRSREVEMVIGLRTLLPRLHAHTELHKMIPYLGLLSFIWWPADGYELALNTWHGRSQYYIALTHCSALVAETTVPIDNVIDTLLDYVSKAQNGANQG